MELVAVLAVQVVITLLGEEGAGHCAGCLSL